MKRFFKLFLVILSLVMVIGVSAAFSASAEDTENDSVAAVEDIEVSDIAEKGEDSDMTLKIDPDNMISSLQYMWKGMLCIFVVIGVIILSVYFMGFVFSKFEAKKED